MRLLALAAAAQIVMAVAARPAAQRGGSAALSQRTAASRGIEGVWSFSTLTPLERPPEFAGRALVTDAEAAAWVKRRIDQDNADRRDGPAQIDVERAVNDYWFERGVNLARRDGLRMTSLIVDPAGGRMPPLTAAAKARLAAAARDEKEHPGDGPENRSLQERCLAFNAGPPMLPALYNNYVQIFEMPGYVVIFNEMIHDARIVPLDNRPRPPASIRRWQGEPSGRWEGDTLVVDTVNFSHVTNLPGADERLHLIERFTRVDEQTLNYEFTVDDPTAYTRSWKALLPMTKTNERLFEYACHEGNYALPDILRGARYEERR